MSKRKEFLYLFQLVIVFIFLSWWRGSLKILLPIGLILPGFFVRDFRIGIINQWNKLGLLLQKIVSPVLFFIVFFFCFYPVALILKIFKKDSLGIHSQPQDTNFHPVNHLFARDDFERMGP